jgi:hypothetical protein
MAFSQDTPKQNNPQGQGVVGQHAQIIAVIDGLGDVDAARWTAQWLKSNLLVGNVKEIYVVVADD